MSNLLKLLRGFERKERFAVLTEAIGFNPDKIPLDDRFHRELEDCVGRKVPSSVFLAMDYHLDWIEIALHLHQHRITPSAKSMISYGRAREINRNQEDIDLLIAFDCADENGNEITHLLLIEAKAFSAWTNKQLNSKARRLRRIFGEEGRKHDGVQPHFLLMSGRVPMNVCTEEWPQFMRKGNSCRILKYVLPSRLKITRSNAKGRNDAKGDYLRFDTDR